MNKTHIDLARDRGRAASTLVRVDRLLRDPALSEIDADAMIAA